MKTLKQKQLTFQLILKATASLFIFIHIVPTQVIFESKVSKSPVGRVAFQFQVDYLVVGSKVAKYLLCFSSVCIVNVSFHSWRQIKNRRRTLTRYFLTSKKPVWVANDKSRGTHTAYIIAKMSSIKK